MNIRDFYNTELSSLTKLLSGVKRPGDFYATGSLVAPMPRLDIDGVGTVSFPLPDAQAGEIVRQADLAPYGKGEQTIIDTQIRKVWQVAPARVRLSGTAWTGTLETILAQVTAGLGCQKVAVSAELYKVLLYDAGSFFIAHRDTEKAEGMFGTLVIVLPSFHSGGELAIRHAGREVSLDLATKDVSQVTYAAFYADCEHEVRPITDGNRLCLVFNLIQQRGAKKPQHPLTAPDYNSETVAAAKLLEDWTEQPDTPPKIVYLLEHQYSPIGLSFSGLKNADAALGKVLSQAAQRAGYAIHLGIVHIEESGAAELTYQPSYGRSKWRHYDDEENESEGEDDASDQDFQVIDVCDSSQYISDWVDLEDGRVDFGEIPLGDGELLPEEALDGEKPDRQRVTEATGNEGASFERSYHRAAIILWHETRYPEVLLQAGAGAALPYLRKQVQQWSAQSNASSRSESRQQIASLAKLIIDSWAAAPDSHRTLLQDKEKPAKRAEMLKLLRTIGDPQLLQQFIENPVTLQYDGSENAELTACIRLLGPQKAGDLISSLVEKNMPLFHGACVDLLRRLVKEEDRNPDPGVEAANQKIAGAAVAGLSRVEPRENAYAYREWWRAAQAKPVDATLVANLIGVLRQLQSPNLSQTAADTLVVHPELYAPDTVIVPALSILQTQHGDKTTDDAFFALWKHSAEFLLARSEFPPEEPRDWAQPVKLDCQCADCKELQAFAKAPDSKIHRFRVKKERRQHLHQVIERHDLDMTHQTERVGSPQTLVCTKTRRSHQKRCKQYAQDIESFRTLAAVAGNLKVASLLHRIHEAIRRT